MKHRQKIHSLFFWDSTPNFGDEIGRDIVAHVLGCELPKAQSSDEGVLFSCGSILHYADRFASSVVWGSGYEPHYGTPPRREVRYCAVRGPRTAEAIGWNGGVYGDPAILASELHPRAMAPDPGRIGVVVHHSTMRLRLRDRVLFNPHRSGYAIIDPRRPWREVVDDICRCEFVFCQSLHGAIMSEVYGVPWVWWKGFHGRLAKFKWEDWFASIGATPTSFSLRSLGAAQRHAERRQSQLPDREALKLALMQAVEVQV